MAGQPPRALPAFSTARTALRNQEREKAAAVASVKAALARDPAIGCRVTLDSLPTSGISDTSCNVRGAVPPVGAMCHYRAAGEPGAAGASSDPGLPT